MEERKLNASHIKNLMYFLLLDVAQIDEDSFYLANSLPRMVLLIKEKEKWYVAKDPA